MVSTGKNYLNDAWNNYENITFENQYLLSQNDPQAIKEHKQLFVKGLYEMVFILIDPQDQNATENSTFIYSDWAPKTLEKYSSVVFEIDCLVLQKEIENSYEPEPEFLIWFDHAEAKVTIRTFSMFIGDFDYPLYEKFLGSQVSLRSIASGKK
ncbi:hypothetical protein [Bacillus mycoides]|uniref:hypothetical protein n=1 Tax=Bacillus mycoides TaxID=1405 RepID=UPI00131A311C|nr:hypothetical protein [Bacillus mycoides]